MKKLAWHFDFHSHREVRIGHDPNVEEAARALAGAQVEEIITFAKCHTGFSYYPTRIGSPHPKMVGDPFGDMLRACRRRGIRVLAYLSFGIDGEAVRRHGDWAFEREQGKQDAHPNGFIYVCPFSPYIDELFLPQLREIIEGYGPDGFFFDTMGAFSVCYCAHCRRVFQAAHGRAIPTRPEDPDWGLYGRFRHDRAFVLLDRIGGFITSLSPAAAIGFNHIGTMTYPERMPESINRLTLDFSTHGPQSRQASLCANYGSTAPIPSDVMPTRFNQGWGDWSAAPALALEQVAAPVLAYGARLYMGDRLHPANRITQGTREAIDTVSRLWHAMAAHLPPEGTRRRPDVVVLHSPRQVYGENFENFDRSHNLLPLQGAHRLLADAGANFALVAEDYLEKWLTPERLLVLPELPALGQTTDALIRKFLAAGGQLLAVGRAPRVDGRAVDWLGVDENPEPWQDYLYLPWSASTGRQPVLVRGTSRQVRPRGAAPLCYPYIPYDLRSGVMMGWGANPPADEPASSPVLTRNDVGRGRAFYLGSPLFSDYAAGINFQQKQWLEDFWPTHLPSPRVHLHSTGGSVEMVVYESDGTIWVVLLNHGGEELAGPLRVPRTLGPLPAYPVEVRLTGERSPRAVTLNGQPCGWKMDASSLVVPIVMDDVWKCLRIDR